MSKKNKKEFKLFDFNRNGRGVIKNEDKTPNLKYFFVLLWRNFPKLFSINLMILLLAVPIVAIFLIYIWGPTTPAYVNTTAVPLLGISIAEQGLPSPAISLLSQIMVVKIGLKMITPAQMIAIAALGLVEIFTWGWQNSGITYLIRGVVKGEPIFILTDYFYAVKKNLKQGFLFGIIDLGIISLLIFDFIYFYKLTGSFTFDFMFFSIFALVIIYFLMRFYLYMLMITFDIKTRKIFKNALIFSVLGIKRNLLGIVGMLLFFGINYLIFSLSVPLGIAIPLVYYPAVVEFIKAYSAYPIIEKYMISPPPEAINSLPDNKKTPDVN